MPGPFINWRAMAHMPPEVAWYVIVNARRTGRVDPRFLEEPSDLFVSEEPPRAFPAKLFGILQTHAHLMSYRFSEDPGEQETYRLLMAGDEAALSVARDFCRLTWIDAVYTLPVDHADVRYFTTVERPAEPAPPADDPRPRVVYAPAPAPLLSSLANRPVRAGEIVAFDGAAWMVVQFVVRTRGGLKQVDMFDYLDVPFDPEFMAVDSLALIPARYLLAD